MILKELNVETLSADVLAYALDLGFDPAGIIPAEPPRYRDAFAAWLVAGYDGEMRYLAARAGERADPAQFAPSARSIIVLAANYSPAIPQLPASPADRPAAPPAGRVARYAQGPDYHEVIKPKLYALDAFIRARTGRSQLGKVFVDSAPVLERDFAEQAGLGFIGRNCCLITPGLGSWTFLAGLMVPEKLTVADGRWQMADGTWQQGASPGCGRCTRCLDACPTRAFVGPHVLDARRCISYLTIELRGAIPHELRPLMGNWVFGCDACQEVCPYNRAALPTVGRDFGSRADLRTLSLAELLALDEPGFRARFRGTPVMRARRRGLVRNACVAAGNSGDATLVPALAALLADPEPLIRGHAAWALGRIGGAEAERALTLWHPAVNQIG